MPELPDVEGFRRVLARHASGQRIERVLVPDPAMLRRTSPQALGRALRGSRFENPLRHGKWVIAPAEGTDVLMHFGMTGLLEWKPPDAERHPHDRVVFVCSDGELRYRNMRRFGAVGLARDEQEREAVTGPLGPDAHGISREDFDELIRGRRGAIKPALMDQSLIAGIGNLLADEMLWRARVNPRTAASSLSATRRGRLHAALRETLRTSIPAGRVPHAEGWITRVRDGRDPRCPRCGARMRKAQVGGRTACWCPREQRR